MSYRPDEQSLEDPLGKILEGIEEYSRAVSERIRSGDWKDSHIEEITRMRADLQILEGRLAALRSDNW